MTDPVLIPLTRFVDYVLSPGPARPRLLPKLGAADPYETFYRPVREAVVDMHQRGLSTRALDDLTASLVDPSEQRTFPRVVAGHRRFLKAQRKALWFEPPVRDYPLGPLTVHVAPDLGLLLDGRPHALKLWYRKAPPSDDRVALTNALTSMALWTTWPGTVFGVLDVRRSRILTACNANRAWLRAEAVGLDAYLRAVG